MKKIIIYKNDSYLDMQIRKGKIKKQGGDTWQSKNDVLNIKIKINETNWFI